MISGGGGGTLASFQDLEPVDQRHGAVQKERAERKKNHQAKKDKYLSRIKLLALESVLLRIVEEKVANKRGKDTEFGERHGGFLLDERFSL